MSNVVHFHDLPRGDEIPSGTKVPRAARRAQAGLARRDFLRLTTAAAVGTGLAFASVFPTARRAYGDHLTPASLSSACYSELVPGTGCCACGSEVSSVFCGPDGWHKHHSEGYSGEARNYRLRTTSCGGTANAWEWDVGGTRWRCSDGEYQVCYGADCGSWVASVCPAIV